MEKAVSPRSCHGEKINLALRYAVMGLATQVALFNGDSWDRNSKFARRRIIARWVDDGCDECMRGMLHVR